MCRAWHYETDKEPGESRCLSEMFSKRHNGLDISDSLERTELFVNDLHAQSYLSFNHTGPYCTSDVGWVSGRMFKSIVVCPMTAPQSTKQGLKTKTSCLTKLIALVYAAPHPRHASMPKCLERVSSELTKPCKLTWCPVSLLIFISVLRDESDLT